MTREEKSMIHRPGSDDGHKRESVAIELDGFPDSIQELYQVLPNEIKEKIFSGGGLEEDGQRDKKRSLEEVIACLKREQREEFASECLSELFGGGSRNDFKRAFDREGVDVGAEVTKFLDMTWGNRGKGKDDVEIFNQGYFDDFFEQREVIVQEIRQLQAKIDALKASAEKTKRQRRLTEKKKRGVHKSEWEEMPALKERLHVLDRENESLSYFSSPEFRASHEKEWTYALAVIAEYLEPDELAVVVLESMDRCVTFYDKRKVARGEKRWRRASSEREIGEAREFMEKFDSAFEEWQEAHEGDGSLKSPKKASDQIRQQKMIDYFQNLYGSYKRGKERGRTDDDMLMNVRQMEVTLNLLGKINKQSGA